MLLNWHDVIDFAGQMSRNNILTSPLSKCVAEVKAMLESYPRVTVLRRPRRRPDRRRCELRADDAYVARHPIRQGSPTTTGARMRSRCGRTWSSGRARWRAMGIDRVMTK